MELAASSEHRQMMAKCKQIAEYLEPPSLVEFKASEGAAVAKITGYVFITLPSNCSNAGYACRGSRSGFIFSQM